MKNKIYILIWWVFIFIVGLNFVDLINIEKGNMAVILGSLAQDRIEIQNHINLIKERNLTPKIKVDFWKVELQSKEKGKYVGTAELIGGKLLIDVKDPRLKNILENPYTPVGEISEEGTVRDWQVSYSPGSLSHLKAIAREAWRWGYIAKTQELQQQ